jgi:tol-pal system protein YbgF
MNKHAIFAFLFFSTTALAGAAQAQRFEAMEMNQRMARLENELQMLQQHAVSSGGVAPSAAISAPAANAGKLGAEISRIDEEMRSLRGQLEKNDYEIEQLKKKITSMQEDMDYRFQEIADQQRKAQQAVILDDQTQSEPEMKKEEEDGSADLSKELTTSIQKQPRVALENPAKLEAAPQSARDLYNHAFKQLNQNDYQGAQTSFTQFTSQFGEDPLIGNAWYWLGEAYYVQRDYLKAANSFRQGYSKLPDGPKAGDNLLKLGMSLSALNRSKEACVVLKQVDKKYAANSEAIRTKTRQELSRLACK